MILNAANALTSLFNHSKDSLSSEALEFYSDLTEAVICESTNMALSLSALGALYSSESDNSALPARESLGAVLFSLSSQAEMIGALTSVSSDAAYILSKKKVSDIKKPD
ncbi:MAG: hypothetical protein WCG16_11910 [Methylococcales bacterium]